MGLRPAESDGELGPEGLAAVHSQAASILPHQLPDDVEPQPLVLAAFGRFARHEDPLQLILRDGGAVVPDPQGPSVLRQTHVDPYLAPAGHRRRRVDRVVDEIAQDPGCHYIRNAQVLRVALHAHGEACAGTPCLDQLGAQEPQEDARIRLVVGRGRFVGLLLIRDHALEVSQGLLG